MKYLIMKEENKTKKNQLPHLKIPPPKRRELLHHQEYIQICVIKGKVPKYLNYTYIFHFRRQSFIERSFVELSEER